MRFFALLLALSTLLFGCKHEEKNEIYRHSSTITCCMNGAFHWCDNKSDLDRCTTACHRDPEHDQDCKQPSPFEH